MPVLGLLLVFLASGSVFAETQGEVSLRQDSFVSPQYSSTNSKSFGFLGGHLKQSTETTGLVGDITGEFVPQNPMMSYLNVQELYHRESFFSVGRKLYAWNRLDEDFNLGVFQPQFRWNPLDPSSQGLTGIYMDLQNQIGEMPWGMMLFASFTFIPDQGSSYQLRDGQFEPANPWFRTPPQRAQFDDQGKIVDQINYDLQKPSVNEVVYNTSFVGALYLGEDQKGFKIQAVSAYKPSNQLALGTDGVLTPNNSVDVKIVPKIYYHSLVGGDLQYSFSNFQIGLSGLSEHPHKPEFDQTLTYNNYNDSRLGSVFVAARAGRFQTHLSRLTVQGGEAQVQGPKAKELASVLPQRFPYRSANKISAVYEYKWKKYEGLKGQATYMQGDQNEFELVKLSLGWQIDPKWSAQAQGLLVRASNTVKTVFSDYEDNDQVQMGVSYVF
ncbi:MAG: hypothetical protein BroJett040_23190 [Oligoflexia bacterium]|nr:MAG: hypothetical protein BroJett040_23190 [Oligoflexia bacterium]